MINKLINYFFGLDDIRELHSEDLCWIFAFLGFSSFALIMCMVMTFEKVVMN
ncbi:hypothetical protein ACFPYN_02905 [Paenisporosarcina macmurdoensis]|uniref:DUF3961 domain-containing protein n=1 Tax=Paenisporosarcina macmurdoensis TaxID=212659 RepID=A0ABW1L4I2_9BACL